MMPPPTSYSAAGRPNRARAVATVSESSGYGGRTSAMTNVARCRPGWYQAR